MKKISLFLALVMLFSIIALPQTGSAAGKLDPYVGFGMGLFDETTASGYKVTEAGMLGTSGANQTYTYKNVDFGDVSPTSVKLTFAGDASNAGLIVRLYVDSTNNTPIAEFVSETAGWGAKIEHTAEITQEITGVHTLYLKTASKTMDFQTVRFIQPLTGSLVYEEYSTENNAYTDIAESEYRREINILKGIGLSHRPDALYYPSLPVTRGAFTEIIAKIGYAVPQTSTEPVFTDVDEQHARFDSIMSAYAAGYVGGFEDGSFRPEEFITLSDALRIASRVLGYDYIAKAKGGTDSAYYEIGRTYDLTDGIENISVLTNEALACFVLNMANAKPYKPAATSDFGVSYEVGEKTLLAATKDIYRTVGVIEKNNITSLASPVTNFKDNCVSVDGVDYMVGDSGARSLLGYECEIYYKLADNEKTILAIEPVKNIKITELTTDKTDIVSLSATEVVYYDADYKQVELGIEDAHVLYNGVCADAALSSLMEETPFRGRIKYIENRSGVNVLFVDEYVNVEIGGADTAQRSFYDNLSKKTYRYPESEGFVYMTMNGKSVALGEAKTGLVAMLYESKNTTGKRFARLTLSDAVVSGSISMAGDNEVTVGNNTYRLAREFADTLQIGAGTELKLNAYGEVVSANSIDTTLRRYAWLYEQGRTEANGFTSGAAIMRVRDKDNTINVYSLAETCVVNGETYTDGTATLLESMCNNPVIYYLNSKGEVKEIITCGDGGLLASKSLSSCYYNTASRILTASSKSSYMLSETGAGMRKYENATVEEDWEWLASPSFNSNFGAVVYSTDFDSGVLEIIMWGGVPASFKNESKTSFVFDSMSEVLDENGEVRPCLIGYSGTSSVKYMIDERNEQEDIPLARALSKGDLITASVGSGKMWDIELIYLANGESSLSYGSATVESLVGEHQASSGTVSSTTSAPRYVYAQVIDRDGNHFRIQRPGTGEMEFLYPETVMGIKYKKSLGDKLTYNVSKDGIELGDTIVLVYKNTTLNAFYIVK